MLAVAARGVRVCAFGGVDCIPWVMAVWMRVGRGLVVAETGLGNG